MRQGPFLLPAGATRASMGGMATTDDGKLVQARFAWDAPDDEATFVGWHDPEVRWNGFATPAFERAEADRLMGYVNAMALGRPEETAFSYDAARDCYVERAWDHSELDPVEYEGYDRDGRHLYGIGAWSWTWSEVPPRGWAHTG